MAEKLPTITAPPTFIRKTGELTKLLKRLDKASDEAVDMLLSVMQTTEDERLKIACADKLLGFQVAVAKEVNDDILKRMISEVRIAGQALPGQISMGSSVAVIDFSQIQTVD